MRVAARRSTRVGARSGVPLEDLGVVPDERYYMTRNDLLQDNADLIAHAAKILKGKRQQTLQLATTGAAPFAQVRGDVDDTRSRRSVRRWPSGRVDRYRRIVRAPTAIALPKPITAQNRVEAYGYRKGELVVSTRLAP